MDSPSDIQQSCPACGSFSTGRTRRYVSTGREPFKDLHIVECSNCGTGRASPMPGQDRLIGYYSSQYESLEGAALSSGTSAWDLGPARAASQVRMVVKYTKRRGSWLDVGAGYGYLLDAARAAGWSTSGIEPGISRQHQINSRGHQVYVNLDEVHHLQDVISLSHSLEHVADPVGYLGALGNLLAPKGLIFCEVPNDEDLLPPSFRSIDEPHVVFFSRSGLVQCARSANLRMSVMTTAGPSRGRRIPSPRSLLSRYGRYVLPSAAVPHVHFTNWEGGDRSWIRAIFSTQTVTS